MTGKSEPTEGELENFEEPDPADSRVQHVGGKVPQGIPYFWLTVLSNQVRHKIRACSFYRLKFIQCLSHNHSYDVWSHIINLVDLHSPGYSSA